MLQAVRDFPNRENCTYSEDGFVCKVPDGHYFMMVTIATTVTTAVIGVLFRIDKHCRQEAFLVWMNFGNLKRIGTLYRIIWEDSCTNSEASLWVCSLSV